MGRARYVYDIYDNKTGFPIIIGGTVRECARALGISEVHFRCYVIHSNRKRTVIKNVIEDTNNKFGSRCRRARMIANLTQAEVAKAIGVSLPTYKKYEEGQTLPDIEITARIAQVLKVNIRYLAGGYYEQEKV